mgnify:CR=1 FL=1
MKDLIVKLSEALDVEAEVVENVDYLKHVRFSEGKTGWNGSVSFGIYTVSIFVGYGAYSSPRRKLQDPQDYTAFEVAVLRARAGESSSDFITNSILDVGDDVAGYLTRDEVNSLIEMVDNKWKSHEQEYKKFLNKIK